VTWTPTRGEAGPAQFTPGSTPDFSNHRRFLCCNLTGCIFLRENPVGLGDDEDGDATSVDVEFADIVRYRNRSVDNRTHRLILGSLSSMGVVLASRTILQRCCHDEWAPDSEFSCKFPEDETIDLVACGDGWFCAATERAFLRVFVMSRFEIVTLSLPARPRTIAGDGASLAAVFCDDAGSRFQL
jgi:hypothetical protein